MAKYLFPAIFDQGNDGSEGYTVTFPDLPGCITEGSDLQEAMSMARDALSGFLYGMEEDGETIPTPSSPANVQIEKGAFVALVEAWTDIIREETENKAVKKTLTIPKWLNDAAEKEGVNFSHLLQYAIKERLGIRKRSS
ncbi:pilus assembly protein HicB [Pueribacillus theae]|uniref:Pilus assembly protein HicB n=1 Tax=Pueribacillus theae TaxID=2171751 RepID=A0A2U1K582_9BACI|nr:type II toxin-antitoxin system HicB family antitoxin [Pueribacillus theae]PWA12660.1 pilus assembly protein HicB [Pueribacillus theae]